MKETPEPLAAILAEMRADVVDGENAFFIRADWLALCDRIEAAAKQEAIDAELKWTRIGYEERKAEEKSTPGNVATLRKALKKIRREYCDGLISCQTCVSSEADVERVSDLFEKQIDTALAAPARNCDRFATYEEAVKAYRAWTEQSTGSVSNVSGRGMLGWLFAPAEGGAK